LLKSIITRGTHDDNFNEGGTLKRRFISLRHYTSIMTPIIQQKLEEEHTFKFNKKEFLQN